MTVAFMQDDASFIGAQASPFVTVDKRSNYYYTYPQGTWNRREMKIRGSGEESAGSGWTQSSDTYSCERYAIHHDEDWADKANADAAFNVDQDASEWLANQCRIQADYLWQAAAFQPAVWTTDYDGVSSGPSTSEILQWDSASSDPQTDVMTLQAAIHALIGRYANTLVVGADVHTQIVTHPIVRAAIQYTSKTFVGNMTNAELAAFFGVQKYLVAGGIYNSAVEGQTASMGYLCNAKDLWLGYVNPNPGLKKMSASYTFAYNGPEGVGSDGVVVRSFDIDERTCTRFEAEMFVDVKVISVDAAAFVDDCVA